MANRWGNSGNNEKLYFRGSKIKANVDCSHEINRCLLPGRKAMTNLDSTKKQRYCITKKCPSCQSYYFSSSYVWMWESDYKESWAPKNWCFWTVVLDKTLENPLDCKKIQLAHSKGNQSWIFIGRTDAETETLILWPPDAKNWLIGKDLDAGKVWRPEEKGTMTMRWLDGITNLIDMSLSKPWVLVMDRKARCAAAHEITKSCTWLREWAELNMFEHNGFSAQFTGMLLTVDLGVDKETFPCFMSLCFSILLS